MSVSIGSYRVRFDADDGTLEREGTDTPPGARVVMMVADLMAVKLPGRKVYTGQGQPWRYVPACFEVYEILREDDDGWLLVRPQLSWDVRS